VTTATLFTVGHSNDSFEHLLELLRRHSIRTVIDIRSVPYSGRLPQFNRPVLDARLRVAGVTYRFQGDALGGHPKDASFYLADGRVNFDLVEQDALFRRGIEALVGGELGATPVLLCSEAEPLDCPRFFLIGRILDAAGVGVMHVRHSDGALETQSDCEARMLVATGMDAPDLLSSRQDQVNRAYAILKQRYGYRGPPSR
jgi:uncharacterized protein (DUF488 family)